MTFYERSGNRVYRVLRKQVKYPWEFTIVDGTMPLQNIYCFDHKKHDYGT